MIKIVGVKFKNGNKVYYFAPGKDRYKKGMGVIVETVRGTEYANVVIPYDEITDDKIVSPLKPIIRIATKRDEEQLARNEEKSKRALEIVEEKIKKHNLDMKVISCEYAFDGAKAFVTYTADGRVDFRELVKDLKTSLKTNVDLRQIGIRDEIKLVGGLGPCGRECCCCSCMNEFKAVSIKMAKNQGLSLKGEKISGRCGKLMCCLGYENDYYADAVQKMPKIGSEVETPDGKGIVANNNMLKMEVKVKIENKDAFVYKDFKIEDVKFKRKDAQPKPENEEKGEKKEKSAKNN